MAVYQCPECSLTHPHRRQASSHILILRRHSLFVMF